MPTLDECDDHVPVPAAHAPPRTAAYDDAIGITIWEYGRPETGIHAADPWDLEVWR